MATVGASLLTLADWAKRIDPDGTTPTIVELFSQRNEILLDMNWMQGNLPTGHRVTVRTGLPTAAWRLLNGGVSPSKSTTAQIDEQCGILEGWSEVDSALIKLNGNGQAFRLSEGAAFIEAMNQEFVRVLFYGNSGVDPEQFTGLSPRYADTTAGNGANVILGGSAAGQTDNMSIWLIGWGDQSISGIFPKGSKAGLEHKDWGEQVIEQTAGVGGTRLVAFRDQWIWNCGIALKDWRNTVRIPNIDSSNLTTQSSNANLPELMIKAIHRLNTPALVKPVFYMNRTTFEFLDIQCRQDVRTGGQLKYEEVEGRPVVKFRGYPIRISDQLVETETRVT